MKADLQSFSRHREAASSVLMPVLVRVGWGRGPGTVLSPVMVVITAVEAGTLIMRIEIVLPLGLPPTGPNKTRLSAEFVSFSSLLSDRVSKYQLGI